MPRGNRWGRPEAVGPEAQSRKAASMRSLYLLKAETRGIGPQGREHRAAGINIGSSLSLGGGSLVSSALLLGGVGHPPAGCRAYSFRERATPSQWLPLSSQLLRAVGPAFLEFSVAAVALAGWHRRKRRASVFCQTALPVFLSAVGGALCELWNFFVRLVEHRVRRRSLLTAR